jgi:hypothetical protein
VQVVEPGMLGVSADDRSAGALQSAVDRGPRQPGFATHPRTDSGAIETDTMQRAAQQLDLALAMSEVYRSYPSFAAPHEVWERRSTRTPSCAACSASTRP